MKIWELDLTGGKLYKDSRGTEWTACNGTLGRRFSAYRNVEITDEYGLAQLLALSFTEVQKECSI